MFVAICRRNSGVVSRAIAEELVIPDFPAFVEDISGIYNALLTERGGAVADYIPQLGRVNPEQLAISVCTVDGQRFSVGDSRVSFCVQSVCKPINYCLALEEHGAEAVHRHVGCEPSGVRFNELSLNEKGLPHNPMVNSGAIMCSSVIRVLLPVLLHRYRHRVACDRGGHAGLRWGVAVDREPGVLGG
jgi:glutaminase